MGLYYVTYICYGNFSKRIDRKVKLRSMDNMIEHHEKRLCYKR